LLPAPLAWLQPLLQRLMAKTQDGCFATSQEVQRAIRALMA
jgi:hypothetical protein